MKTGQSNRHGGTNTLVLARGECVFAEFHSTKSEVFFLDFLVVQVAGRLKVDHQAGYRVALISPRDYKKKLICNML